jgi:hypothetical protein
MLPPAISIKGLPVAKLFCGVSVVTSVAVRLETAK